MFSLKSGTATIAVTVCCFVIMASGCTATPAVTVAAPDLLLSLDQNEGGTLDANSVTAFESYMAGQGCPLRLTTSVSPEAELLFAARPLASADSAKFVPLLQASTHEGLPLTAAVVVKASTGISSLQNLDNATIGVISDTSYMGYEVPMQMFAAAGVTMASDKLWKTGSFDSIIVLLLHQDIFAAVLPGPLARRWAKANNLAIVAESAPLDIGTLWANRELEAGLASSCKNAFVSLQRTPFSDNRMAVFPRWAEGFR